ncbi:MAG: hypothetical protein ACRYFX_07500 [Janthinobacterium lividum]
MLQLFDSLFAWVAARTAHRHWRGHLALATLLVAVVFQFPKLNHAYAQLVAHTEALDPKLQRIQEQAAHPGALHSDVASTHLAKMNFRLAVPLLLRLTHLPLLAILALQALLGLLVFYYAAGWLAISVPDRVAVALLTLALGRTYFGFTFTYDLSGYFDGFGYAALLFMLGARRWAVVFGLCLAGAFVDERVLVASPLLVFWYGARTHDWQRAGWRWLATRLATAVYAAWAAYAALRLTLAAHYHLPTRGGLVGPSALVFSTWNEQVAIGLANSLKSFWLPVVLALALLWQQRQRGALLLLLASFAPIFLGSFLITDITRSLAFGMPVAFISLHLLGRHSAPPHLRYLGLVVVFFALLIPSYFTIGLLQYASPVWMAALRMWAGSQRQ